MFCDKWGVFDNVLATLSNNISFFKYTYCVHLRLDMILTDFKNIRCIVLDVDGVLTNGDILVNEAGDQLRTFNVKDGYAMQYAVKNGLQVWVITGAKSRGVFKRMEGLGIQEIHIGVTHKWPLLEELMAKYAIEATNIAFIGDDMPDLTCMQQVAVAICPADAAEEIRKVSHYVSTKKGGQGVVRETLEKIMKLQGLWHNDSSIKSI